MVAHVDIDYKSPAQLYDTIQIETTISEVCKVSFWIDYKITRKSDNKLLTTGRTKMACLDNDMKLLKIPPEVSSNLK